MINIQKKLFVSIHTLYDKRFKDYYDFYIENQWKSNDELKQQQEEKLNNLAKFVNGNIYYYQKLFIDYGVSVNNFGYNELLKLPIITKQDIKKCWDQFVPTNIKQLKKHVVTTGGTTGVPLKFFISHDHRLTAGILLYRGWLRGGYNLGDRMALIAGQSLDNGSKNKLLKFIHERLRNIRYLSAFDQNEFNLHLNVKNIQTYKPEFLRGYASSVYEFAKYVKNKNIHLDNIKSVFTTADKLTEKYRKVIEEAFNCEVFDTYGLNDGGVTAYECEKHNGLHIDTENAILEVLDENNQIIVNGIGKVIATSLNNFAFPFIRYETGDLAEISNITCNCGRKTKLLKQIIGRQTDNLITPTGKTIHGAAFFNNVFNEIINNNNIDSFQVVQNKPENIIIKFVSYKGLDNSTLQKIKEIIKKRSDGWQVDIEFVDFIDTTTNGKHRFIINNIYNK